MRIHRRVRERGQGLVEYALILLLVGVVAIGVLALAGQKISEVFCDVVIKIGGTASDSIAACAAPRVTISVGNPHGNNYVIEGVVQDNKGGTQPNITSVKFYLDGSLYHEEFVYKYCMFGGDASCSSDDLSEGTHTIRVVATDADGNTGESSVTLTVHD